MAKLISVSLLLGSALWPNSPATRFFPLRTFLSIAIPAPVPVPIITPNTTECDFPAPSTASERAKQFASFSNLISLFKLFFKSFLKGFPFNQMELAFFIKDVSRETDPGIPIPIDSTVVNFYSISFIKFTIPLIVPW